MVHGTNVTSAAGQLGRIIHAMTTDAMGKKTAGDHQFVTAEAHLEATGLTNPS
jgi:hypothetical protein